jgi:hypothetical protein
MAKRIDLRTRLKVAGCHTLGHLEQLAGIAEDTSARLKFWRKFKDAGTDALLKKIKYRIAKRKLTLVYQVGGKYQAVN